ncbi:MAG: hypothetical protein NTX42_01265 [Methanothrix sp.]|nr:hypothetical protein [Methanothrix sp.]
MTGNSRTKNTKSNYKNWLEKIRKDSIKAIEQKEKFIKDLAELSSM